MLRVDLKINWYKTLAAPSGKSKNGYLFSRFPKNVGSNSLNLKTLAVFGNGKIKILGTFFSCFYLQWKNLHCC